jgi:hypothetical protein
MNHRMLGFNLVALAVLGGALIFLPSVFSKIRDAQTIHFDAAGPGLTVFQSINRPAADAGPADPYAVYRAALAAHPAAGEPSQAPGEPAPDDRLVLVGKHTHLTDAQRQLLLQRAEAFAPASSTSGVRPRIEVVSVPTTDDE